MGCVLAMKPWLLVACLALAGCSSGGTGKITSAALQEIRGLLPGGEAGGDAPEAAPAGPRLTRAAVDEAGVAMIRAGLASEQARSILTAFSANGPYVTYVSRFGQTLTLRGSRITGTRGLGFDLLSTVVEAADPLAAPRPLAAWPGEIRRRYVFPGDGPAGRRVEVTCRFEPGERLEITIVEIVHVGRVVQEFCTGDASFTNQHLVDIESGFVWRSRQWMGAGQGLIDLEVIEPVTQE